LQPQSKPGFVSKLTPHMAKLQGKIKARVAIGTCGFSYRGWIGPVYPKGTKSAAMLGLYAARFPVVELDVTYYRIPPAATFAAMAARTPATFRFCAKLPGAATHLPAEARGSIHLDVEAFRRALDPLLEAGRFAVALAQFPTSFRANEAARDHLAALRRALPDLRLAAEFRHREWQSNETLTLLRELQIAIVNVDEPQFKDLPRPSSDVTADFSYVRFHGRNYATWWRGTNETRYDYEYPPAELKPWAQRIVDISANPDVREVLAFFNNHARGQAVRNAELFEGMLESQLPAGALVRA
jgi:uncharacterized protein YecE (DUF72 family)